MAVTLPFTLEHVSSLAARAEQLERLGEDLQEPRALLRAARLYRLATRITDDLARRPGTRFSPGDLARVRGELRTLATDAAASGLLGDDGITSRATADTTGTLTRAFREIALRVEQRLDVAEVRPQDRPDAEWA